MATATLEAMPLDYDILIAGAGPAGCAAAYDLARAGKRVLLLDKRSFPRHKACACGLTRKTLNTLRYSVDPIIERVCHEIVLQNAAPGTEPNSRRPRRTEVRVKTRTPICAMAVRERFDEFCLNQTLAMGAHLRKIDSILALRELPGHIELDITTADGPITLTAPILIGADGSNGQTRRLAADLPEGAGALRPPNSSAKERALAPAPADPAWYSKGFALEAKVPFSSLPKELSPSAHDLVFDFAPLPGGYGWLFPKGDHINIGVGTFADGSDASLKQVTRQLLLDYTRARLGLTTLDLTTIDQGEPIHITGQYLGMGGQNYLPHGRILLVGDAAGLVDPLTGEGIHSALVSGQAAAAAVLATGTDVAATYARNLQPLQQTLAFSARAARSFYKTPERGFKAMRLPFMRSLILKTYADGLPHTRLLTALAKLV